MGTKLASTCRRGAIPAAIALFGAATVPLLLSACGGSGVLYVSHPQVNTRERLVQERQREYEWLREQLAKADDITTTFQGVRDFRQFVGLYNELQAAADPSLGAANEIAQQTRESELRTELWRQRRAELEARGEFERSSAKPSGEAESRDDPVEANTSVETPTLPDSTTPLSETMGEVPDVPDPFDPVMTKAKPNTLDLFHDKSAYRNTIAAAMRTAQLDDSHDLAGLMLYELTLNTSVVPGGRNSRFGQITLELQPKPLDEYRAVTLARLYDKWRLALNMTMAADAAAMQSRFLAGKQTSEDVRFVRWFFTRQMTAMLIDMKQRDSDVNELWRQLPKDRPTYAAVNRLISRGAQERLFGLLTPEVGVAIHAVYADILKERKDEDWKHRQVPAEDWRTARKRFESAITAVTCGPADKRRYKSSIEFEKFCNEKAVAELIRHVLSDGRARAIPKDKLPPLLKGIAWAFWAKHVVELARLVTIDFPVYDKDTGRLTGGLAVNPIAPLTSSRRLEGKLRGRAFLLPRSAGVSNTGVCTFVARISRAEQGPFALSVRPKEYAQNVSEASARESVLNLMVALQAVLPSAGVKAKNRTQFMSRTQEVLHAITRRPLLVGFGEGQRQFGWVLGPKFTVRKGKAEYEHVPVRHDCSASIVVPAWWNSVTLTGESGWVSWDGSLVGRRRLWDGRGERLPLRLPTDLMKRITEALSASNPSGEPFLFTSRPRPVILRVVGVNLYASADSGPGGAKQSLLILGENLWRSPQVFVGSQRASRVEVLSSMKGLLAVFDRLRYPGSTGLAYVDAEVNVVTSFGDDRWSELVRIWAPPRRGVAAPQAPAPEQ